MIRLLTDIWGWWWWLYTLIGATLASWVWLRRELREASRAWADLKQARR